MGDIEGIFLDILLPKTKPIFERIIDRPPNNFLECFGKHRITSILIMKYFPWGFQCISSS